VTLPKLRKPKRKRKAVDRALPQGKDPAWRADGWAPELSPESLVDYLSDVVLAAHRDAIIAGRVPSGEPQRPLDPAGERGRAAAAGKRPKARGFTGLTDSFPLKIRRGKIQRFAGGARVVIAPGKKHRSFVEKDAARGVEYLTVDGDVDALIGVATERWIDAVLAEQTPEADTDEHDADQAE
jgi:hypothetical protein